MVNDRFITGTLDTEVEKPKLGISIIKEGFVSCPECKAKLLHIVLALESKLVSKYQAFCEDCKAESFVYSMNGDGFAGAVEGKAIVAVTSIPVIIDGTMVEIKHNFKVKTHGKT